MTRAYARKWGHACNFSEKEQKKGKTMLKMGKKAQNIWKLGKNVQNLKTFWKREGYRMQ